MTQYNNNVFIYQSDGNNNGLLLKIQYLASALIRTLFESYCYVNKNLVEKNQNKDYYRPGQENNNNKTRIRSKTSIHSLI